MLDQQISNNKVCMRNVYCAHDLIAHYDLNRFFAGSKVFRFDNRLAAIEFTLNIINYHDPIFTF